MGSSQPATGRVDELDAALRVLSLEGWGFKVQHTGAVAQVSTAHGRCSTHYKVQRPGAVVQASTRQRGGEGGPWAGGPCGGWLVLGWAVTLHLPTTVSPLVFAVWSSPPRVT